jgi:hypothetical protein
MISRERGNIWPVISVAAGAFIVLVVLPVVLRRQQNARMATVDAQVSIGDTGGSEAQKPNSPAYRWPNSEVPRTAERLRDVTAVAIAAMTYVVESELSGHVARNAAEIITGIVRRGLIPSEWLTDQAGVLQMPNGSVCLRYSPASLNVEVISVPKDRADGPAILIRLPDSENVGVGARYFESMQVDGIVYPEPFAPIPTIIASGWQPRLFKQTQIAEGERAQLEQWARANNGN